MMNYLWRFKVIRPQWPGPGVHTPLSLSTQVHNHISLLTSPPYSHHSHQLKRLDDTTSIIQSHPATRNSKFISDHLLSETLMKTTTISTEHINVLCCLWGSTSKWDVGVCRLRYCKGIPPWGKALHPLISDLYWAIYLIRPSGVMHTGDFIHRCSGPMV